MGKRKPAEVPPDSTALPPSAALDFVMLLLTVVTWFPAPEMSVHCMPRGPDVPVMLDASVDTLTVAGKCKASA